MRRSRPLGGLPRLHLRLDLLVESLQLIHIRGGRVPSDAKSFIFIWLGDHVEMDMIDFLVRNTTVVLKNIVVYSARCIDNLLQNREHLAQLVIRDVGELRTVVLGNDESMTLGQGTNVEEGECLFALK